MFSIDVGRPLQDKLAALLGYSSGSALGPHEGVPSPWGPGLHIFVTPVPRGLSTRLQATSRPDTTGADPSRRQRMTVKPEFSCALLTCFMFLMFVGLNRDTVF